jgi:AcrR family transcriptional regulator
MGLREKRAERTRAALHDAVLTLAEESSYDAVTIEQIAERAEVGVSTLYRYFPNKDAILLDPVASGVTRLADAYLARPIDEDREVALGHALHSYLAEVAADGDRITRLRRQLDNAPGPRARLWDLWNQQRTLLEEAIAAREAADPAELWIAVTAHVTMTVAQIALDRQRDAVDQQSLISIVDDVIDTFDSVPGLVPRLPTPAD